jgi:hypothetical protein
MKKKIFFKSFRIPLFIIGILSIGWGAVLDTPVYALGPFLRINVAPSNISFNIVDRETGRILFRKSRSNCCFPTYPRLGGYY